MVAIANRLHHQPSDYLKRMYFDAISYDSTALEGLMKLVGSDRIMFGTGMFTFQNIWLTHLFTFCNIYFL